MVDIFITLTSNPFMLIKELVQLHNLTPLDVENAIRYNIQYYKYIHKQYHTYIETAITVIYISRKKHAIHAFHNCKVFNKGNA